MDFPPEYCIAPVRGEVPLPSHTMVPFIMCKNKTIYLLLTSWKVLFDNNHQRTAFQHLPLQQLLVLTDGLVEPDEQGLVDQTCLPCPKSLAPWVLHLLWGSQYRKYNIYDNISKLLWCNSLFFFLLCLFYHFIMHYAETTEMTGCKIALPFSLQDSWRSLL